MSNSFVSDFDFICIKMAAVMRKAVTSVTDMVFPPPKIKDQEQQKLLNRGKYYHAP